MISLIIGAVLALVITASAVASSAPLDADQEDATAPAACPPASALLNGCACSTSNTARRLDKFHAPPAPRVILRCQGVDDIEALTKFFRELQGNPIDAIQILDSPLGPSIPANLFQGLPVSEVTLSGVNISALSSPGSTPFLGLEQTLRSLALRRCNMGFDMQLQKLTALGHIEQIDLSHNVLHLIRQRWFAVPPSSLKSLILKDNRIETIEDFALRNAQNLIFLDLSENRVSSLQRTMLPDKLEIMHLENNRLDNLEDDLFTSMLNLRRLYLTNNRLHTMKHATFSPIWFKLQPALEQVDVRGNPMVCDCGMSWLSETIVLWRNGRVVLGHCSAPAAFIGDQLRALDCFKLQCPTANCTQLVPIYTTQQHDDNDDDDGDDNNDKHHGDKGNNDGGDQDAGGHDTTTTGDHDAGDYHNGDNHDAGDHHHHHHHPHNNHDAGDHHSDDNHDAGGHHNGDNHDTGDNHDGSSHDNAGNHNNDNYDTGGHGNGHDYTSNYEGDHNGDNHDVGDHEESNDHHDVNNYPPIDERSWS